MNLLGGSSSKTKKVYNTDKSANTASQGSAAVKGDGNRVNIEDGSQEAMDLADSVVRENTAAAESAQDTATDINADALDFGGDALDENADLSVAAIEEMGWLGDTAIGEQAKTSDRAMTTTANLADSVVGTLDGGLRTMAERTESATRGALNWASEATRSDAANTTTTAIQWGAGALALVAVAWAMTR